jgi:tRNA/tmRNA/rRNA uracil-C5-methylase (TrmA/RlmC/RlmD family)
VSRSPRARKARGVSRVGERFEAEVGPVAHGGHCIVRVVAGPSVERVDTVAGQPAQRPPAETRVVFVRHAVPGERVVVEITEGTDGDRFWRGDAVEVLEASPDRVPAPCRFAGPGRCGGCDFQHVDLERQRALKSAVVREQLARLAKLDVPVVVEPVEGDEHGLRWRTRVQFAETPRGERGMRAHRSHRVIPVDDCLIARTDARVVPPPWSPRDRAERLERADTAVRERVTTQGFGAHEFAVEADGFWQVHPGAPRVLVETVLSMLEPQPGEKVMDLYSGVGLFTRFLADAVGPHGRVVAVEGDRTACGHARDNLAGCRGVSVECGSVDRVLAASYDEPFDLVVLDPPREGARRKVVEQIVDRAPRAVAYVACDPAALARDLATFADLGYSLGALRAFDLFPMTHHVECVALLTR